MAYRIDYNTPQGRQWFRDNVPPGFVAIGFACPIDASTDKLAVFQALTRDLAPCYPVHMNNGQWYGQSKELGILAVLPRGYEVASDFESLVVRYCREQGEDCYLTVAGNSGTFNATFRYPNGHCEHQLTFWRLGEDNDV
jgi:hypothetical protein